MSDYVVRHYPLLTFRTRFASEEIASPPPCTYTTVFPLNRDQDSDSNSDTDEEECTASPASVSVPTESLLTGSPTTTYQCKDQVSRTSTAYASCTPPASHPSTVPSSSRSQPKLLDILNWSASQYAQVQVRFIVVTQRLLSH